MKPPTGPALTLAQLMRQAAADLKAQPPPPLPQALLEPASGHVASTEADATRWRLRWFSGGRPAAATMGALALLGATWFVLGPLWNAGDPGRDAPRLASDDNRFVPVAPPERWVRLAVDGASPAWLLTAELPAQRLAAYGLPYDPGRAAEPVRAELLLNPAGDVLAVRVVNPAR